jgi:hypothetical protein
MVGLISPKSIEPLPFKAKLEGFAIKNYLTISYKSLLFANGFKTGNLAGLSFGNGYIQVLDSLDPETMVYVLIHELAHECLRHCHIDMTPEQREEEADEVARLVMGYFGYAVLAPPFKPEAIDQKLRVVARRIIEYCDPACYSTVYWKLAIGLPK